MTFGLDVCSYLSQNHTEWDETVVDGGFTVYDSVNDTPIIITTSDEFNLNVDGLNDVHNEEQVTPSVTADDTPKNNNGFRLNLSKLNIKRSLDFDSTESVLYLNMIPKTKVNCIGVFDTGGYEAVRFHGSCKPIEQPTCQIRVRHQSRRVAEETAYMIYVLMDEVYHDVINNRHYERINAVSPPSYIGSDMVTTSGKAYEFVLNLNSKVRRN